MSILQENAGSLDEIERQLRQANTEVEAAFSNVEMARDALRKAMEVRDQLLKEHEQVQIFLEPIEELELSARSFNCLRRENVCLIGDLLLWDKRDLSNIQGLGKKSLTEIEDTLAIRGLTLGRKRELLRYGWIPGEGFTQTISENGSSTSK